MQTYDLVYVYTSDIKKPLNRYKIGKATRTANSPEEAAACRIKEQQTAGNRDEKFELLKIYFPIKNLKTGYELESHFHKVLKRQNVGGEWFKTDLNQIESIYNELKTGVARPYNYKMRDEQQEAVNSAVKYFNDGGDRFLFNCKMRFGKTFAAFHVMKKLEAKNVLILTYKPAISSGWSDDLNLHVDFKGYNFINAIDYKETIHLSKNENNVIFASFQDILGNKKEIKSRWEKLLKRKYDLLIIDEVHFGAETPIAVDFLTKNIKYVKRLDLSGTPFKLLINGAYSDDQIYSWTYVDEQLKKNQGLKEYQNLPTMKIYTYSPFIEDVKDLLNDYNDMEGLTLTKFFGSDDGENLNNDAAVDRWLDILSSPNPRKFNSPFNNNELKKHMNHMFWYLAGVNNIKALEKKLKNHSFFKDYKIIVAAGDNNQEGKDTLENVKNAIFNFPKTITLSCGKLNTGVSVPEWNSVWMLNDGVSEETYMQTIFRCQTSDTQNNKKFCYVFDFNPNRCLQVVYNYNEVIANKKEIDAQKSIRTFIECMPILAYENNNFVNIKTEDVVDIGIKPINTIKKFDTTSVVDFSCDLNNSIVDILSHLDKIDKIKITQEISECEIANGKNYKNVKKEKSQKEKDETKNLKIRVLNITRMLPSFLYVCDEKIGCLNDIYKTRESKEFERLVGISIEDLKQIEIILNIKNLNRMIQSFRITKEKCDRQEILEYLNNPSSQEVYTPIALVNDVLNKLPENIWKDPALTWCNIGLKNGIWLAEIKRRLMKKLPQKSKFYATKEKENHIINNMLYGYIVDSNKISIANKTIYNDKNFKGNIKSMDKKITMKFDVVVGNPPYKLGAHLQHLQTAVNISKQYVLFVEPIVWLLSIKNTKFNTKENKTKEYIKNILESLDIINGNFYFDAGLSAHIGILKINKLKKDKLIKIKNNFDSSEYTVDDINKINIFNNNEIYNNIINKINYSSSIEDFIKTSGKWYINIANIRGNIDGKSSDVMHKWDFYTFLPDKEKPTTKKDKQYVGFKTKEEAQNFLDSLKTNFKRFCLKTAKLNTHLNRGELKHVPYMGDYSKPWTDKDLYKYFKLTKEEIEYIEKQVNG